MVIPVELLISKASVLWPSESVSPAELSIVIYVRVKLVAPLMLNPWTGVFLILRLEIMEDSRLWA